MRPIIGLVVAVSMTMGINHSLAANITTEVLYSVSKYSVSKSRVQKINTFYKSSWKVCVRNPYQPPYQIGYGWLELRCTPNPGWLWHTHKCVYTGRCI